MSKFESPRVGQNRASGPSAQEMTPELSYANAMTALRLAASIVAGDHPAGEYRVTVEPSTNMYPPKSRVCLLDCSEEAEEQERWGQPVFSHWIRSSEWADLVRAAL